MLDHNPDLKLVAAFASWGILTKCVGPSQVTISLEILIRNVSGQRGLHYRFSELGKILIARSDALAECLKLGL